MTQTATQFANIADEFREEIGIINTMNEHDHPVSEAQQMITEYMQINKPEFAYLVPQLIQNSKYHA